MQSQSRKEAEVRQKIKNIFSQPGLTNQDLLKFLILGEKNLAVLESIMSVLKELMKKSSRFVTPPLIKDEVELRKTLMCFPPADRLAAVVCLDPLLLNIKWNAGTQDLFTVERERNIFNYIRENVIKMQNNPKLPKLGTQGFLAPRPEPVEHKDKRQRLTKSAPGSSPSNRRP